MSRRISSFRAARFFHGLHLYGASSIALFGWAACRAFNWSALAWLPLWFCAALLVYNADRLRRDPADAFNVPLREAFIGRFRRANLAVMLGSAFFLLAWPVVRADWMSLALILAGGAVSLNYSVPLFGFRFKNVPLLKTLFAPSVVTLAVFALPWLHRQPWPSHHGSLTVLGAWAFLLFNMTLCDLRDVEGDRRTGIYSLPVWLGRIGTRVFLGALLALIEGLAMAGACGPSEHSGAWLALAWVMPVYLGSLMVATLRPQPESFYEWWVEGMLFLPAAAFWLFGH